MNKTKPDKKCQVFTPKNYVKELLNSIGYRESIIKKTILENSCGDGNILAEIVKRYIYDAKQNNYSLSEIKKGLEKNIYGFEIDEEQYLRCISKLNRIVKNNGIPTVEWRIFNEDYLRSNIGIKFDYIVGNPPYITYSDLPHEERKFIKENYETCKQGKFDYCYAFIEHSLKALSFNGKMSYLIPSSIFKTVFGNKLRDFMLRSIVQIKDYSKQRIFNDALVKSAIIVFENSNSSQKVSYIDMSDKHKESFKKDLMKEKWIFSHEFNKGNRRFGDFFKVSHVIATLLNEAFVLDEQIEVEGDKFYKLGDVKLEKELIMPTATPKSMQYGKSEKIIFPYRYRDEELIRITEKELKTLFPGVYSYLLQYKDRLLRRKADKSSNWFEYGRSQALSSIVCDKLLVSTIITTQTLVYRLTREHIPYAGMFIAIKNNQNEYDLDYAKEILESDKFLEYVSKIGISINGNSYRITSKDIENFRF